MTWFRNKKTLAKLMMTFSVLAIVMAVVGYQGIRGMAMIDGALDELHEKHAVGLAHLKEAQLAVLHSSRSVGNTIIDASFNETASIEKRFANSGKYEAEFKQHFGAFQSTLLLQESKAKATELEKLYAELREGQRDVMRLAKDGQIKEAHAKLAHIRDLANHVEEALEQLAALKLRVMNEAAAEAGRSYASTRMAMIGAILLGVGVAVGAGLVIGQMIAHPLQATAAVLTDLAEGEGDLTKRVPAETDDEIGQLGKSFNRFMDKLHDIVAQSKSAAQQVADASRHLSSAAAQLSSGAQEQASSLEETAASLEEITGTVRQNADNARQASDLASRSRGIAEHGGEVVAHAVDAMGEINQSSKRISDIITTIDEIAFQTNLLALNAAVEAARAGEQGRGFAVVAAEVRNLAQRSAMAAKEIKTLIEDSVMKVEGGSDLVNRSGETLGEIVGSVKRVTEIIAEIAAASAEQTTGIDQVNRAVTQMDQVTQANSAQTEELSSTAQSLATQAEQLQALVGRFKLAA